MLSASYSSLWRLHWKDAVRLWKVFIAGEVLTSSAKPTQKLDSALQVAQTLDAYVQPRFEILRDRNFGIVRIVFREHAGLVQLKVDTPQ